MVFVNILIITIVAVLAIWIAYISTAIFTKHGQKDIVPNVENLSYTEAIKKLHAAGFKVDIRDSLYRDDVRPGFVIEQFPKGKSIVKPGRKIFLYINALNPKKVTLDDGTNRNEDAMKGMSMRSALSRLEELGFKNVQIIKVLGDNDCVVKVLCNGRTVKKGEKVPLNAKIIMEVYDGRLRDLRDSLQNEELSKSNRTYYYNLEEGEEGYFNVSSGGGYSGGGGSYSGGGSGYSGENNSTSTPQTGGESEEPSEEPDYEFVE